MRFRVTETAFAELVDIAEYIAKDSPSAARAGVMRIEEVFSRIRDFPYLAHTVDSSAIRIFPVRPFPYLVFYTVEQDKSLFATSVTAPASDQNRYSKVGHLPARQPLAPHDVPRAHRSCCARPNRTFAIVANSAPAPPWRLRPSSARLRAGWRR